MRIRTLLGLASHNESADAVVELLIASSAAKNKDFKTKLTALKRRKRFIGRAESRIFAGELLDTLIALKNSAVDPNQGLKSVAAFFEADSAMFNQCDDSDGYVGDVFKLKATELFAFYAAQSHDKEAVVDLVIKLNQNNDYGVRDILFDHMASYLTENEMRSAVDKVWALSRGIKKSESGYVHDGWLSAIQAIAKQLLDAELFEEASRKRNDGTLPTATMIEIARLNLASGNATKALSWMEKVPIDGKYMATERDGLLIEIYSKLDNGPKIIETLRRILSRERSPEALDALLMSVGIEHLYYHHGVSYLRKLDKLAPKVSDWKGVKSEVEYLDELKKQHKLKSRFWKQYRPG